MMAALVASVVLLWIVVVVLAGVVFALTRQIGVLYERVAPAGALMIGRGVVVGEGAPAVQSRRLGGENEMIGAPSPAGVATLVFFLSPTCPVCKTLLPALRTMAEAERAGLRIVLAGDGEVAEHEEFVRRQRLERFDYVLSTQLGMTWQISKLPYAVLYDAAGVVRSHGIVNSREHLESLLEARELGFASIQEFVRHAGGHEHLEQIADTPGRAPGPAQDSAQDHAQGPAMARAKVA